MDGRRSRGKSEIVSAPAGVTGGAAQDTPTLWARDVGGRAP